MYDQYNCWFTNNASVAGLATMMSQVLHVQYMHKIHLD